MLHGSEGHFEGQSLTYPNHDFKELSECRTIVGRLAGANFDKVVDDSARRVDQSCKVPAQEDRTGVHCVEEIEPENAKGRSTYKVV